MKRVNQRIGFAIGLAGARGKGPAGRLDPRLLAALIGAAFAMQVESVHAQQVPIPQTAADVTGPVPGPMTK